MKAVVVHRGARDHYQVARALDERGALDSLVTDLYWPTSRPWAQAIEKRLPAPVRRALAARTAPSLDDRLVRLCGVSGAISQIAAMAPAVPFAMRRRLVRWTDHALGRRARRIAARRDSAILSYSYYAHAAFVGAPAHLPRILFQLHPHPTSVRTILRRELELHPECRVSLLKEWELALPEDDYHRLVDETLAAHSYIAASSFTRQTMIDNGLPGDRIAVAPYGVDLAWFTPSSDTPEFGRPLRVLFVGTINQRKGISYLIEALNHFEPAQIHLTVCGRVVDDLSVLRSARVELDIRPNVSAEELRQQYRKADVFVLPSLAEGFGHVLLEAMACGLPVITTTRTAGPDLIRPAREGFVIEPANAEALVETFQWCLDHRSQLSEMRDAARARAEDFSWVSFRSNVAGIVERFMRSDYVTTGRAGVASE